MKSLFGIVLLANILFVYVICEVITFSFIRLRKDLSRMNKMIVFVLSSCINISFFIFLQRNHYGQVDILTFINSIRRLEIYYQDVQFFSISFLMCVILSCILGLIVRFCYYRKNSILQFDKKQENILLVSSFLAVIFFLTGIFIQKYSVSQIKINEINGNNSEYQLNGVSFTYDYVEISNDGVFPCKLDGLFLSDRANDLEKFSLQGYEIVAGGLLTIYLDDMISFAINQSGETIYLSDTKGQILDRVNYIDTGDDKAFARVKNDREKWGIMSCTPNKSNEDGIHLEIKKPELSNASGFYNDEFDLSISAEPNTTIYYSLDGSIPNETSNRYSTPIHVYDMSSESNRFRSIKNVVTDWNEYDVEEMPIDKAFICRAVAIDTDGNRSDVVTGTYFIQKENFKDFNIISLVADQEQLFGEDGIYVTGRDYDDWYTSNQEGEPPEPNFQKSGIEWEIPADMELISDGNTLLHQNVGIRIQGGYARELDLKRFSIYARKEYSGSERFDYRFWKDEAPPHAVVLRDCFADVICQELVKDRRVAIQRSIPAVLFLNGELWYATFLREKYSRLYFKDHYGVEKDEIVIYKNGELNEGVETDNRLYNDLYSFVEGHDLSSPQNYYKFCELVDIQNYIDYLCINVYTANMDFDENQNTLMWRSRSKGNREYRDGKWRWALFDMDSMEWNSNYLEDYGVDDSAAIDSFSQKPATAGDALNQRTLFKALRKNKDFCREFVVTFMDIVNTDFTVDHVKRELNKWNRDISYPGFFFENRAQYIVKYLAEEFELKGTLENVSLSVNNSDYGSIQINTVSPDFVDGFWNGQYFTDYPITLTAIPNEGYHFARWSKDVEDIKNDIEISVPIGGVNIEAVFEKDEEK